ncbi:MAG: ABC transporter ATP-binding protein, partial [Ruminococcus sp.]|nr:ABC transporter ATP-binding protein [Ruminococcus sp.]
MSVQNENREIAIKLTGVKKRYKLGQIGGGSLQADLQSWWAKVRGKEDPNTKIGEEQRSNGETFMALNGIDLTIYKGEALGIIGGNGAGKSTMLKLLSRVTAPTEGEIDIYGRIASMLEVGTGFNLEMTGRENVYMNGAILGMTKAEIDAKMEEIIEFSEVREFIDTPVKRYSSGMFVKLAFSVAAHLDSEIMIMDEVLAVGDMAFQKKCLDKMRDAAKKEGRTVLYVSHNMNTIRQLCDRCVVLDKGKVLFEGDVEEAIDLYLGKDSNSVSKIDLNILKRNQELVDGVKLTSISIADKNEWRIKVGEKIRFNITVKASKEIKN